MSDEFIEYLALWKVTEQAIANPTKENIEASQQVANWIAGQSNGGQPQMRGNLLSSPLELNSDLAEAIYFSNLENSLNLDKERFGEVLSDLRRKHNLSLANLSAITPEGISARMINDWEGGKTFPPSYFMVREISKSLLLTGEESQRLVQAYIYEILHQYEVL